jgi:integrase
MLTAPAVAKLKSAEKRREIPDGSVRGLYLVIQPSGAKSWVVRYHRNGAATAKLTLGTVDTTGMELVGDPVIGGHLTLAAARQLATKVRRERALGRDPAQDVRNERRARRAAPTFGTAARLFVEEHVKPKTRRWRETARTLGLNSTNLDPIPGGLAARWRHRRLSEVTGGDVYCVTEEARRRGIPGLGRKNKEPSEARARAVASALSVMFGWLHEHRHIDTNPCLGMHRPPAPTARERVLSDDELRWFWAACDGLTEPYGRLLRFLLVIGCRRDEAARMARTELNSDGRWALPAERAKNRRAHTITLAGLALDLIPGGDGDFVFSTTAGRAPVSGFTKIKRRLDAAMAAMAGGKVVPEWRLHDLRRTAATGMARAGVDLHVIERALNHVSGSFGGIVGVYQKHRYEAQVADALEAWATLLLTIVEPSNVVRMRG